MLNRNYRQNRILVPGTILLEERTSASTLNGVAIEGLLDALSANEDASVEIAHFESNRRMPQPVSKEVLPIPHHPAVISSIGNAYPSERKSTAIQSSQNSASRQEMNIGQGNAVFSGDLQGLSVFMLGSDNGVPTDRDPEFSGSIQAERGRIAEDDLRFSRIVQAASASSPTVIELQFEPAANCSGATSEEITPGISGITTQSFGDGPISGGDVLPSVRIVSPGRHATDPPTVPIPEYLQGQAYTAEFVYSDSSPGDLGDLDGTPSVEWRLEKYVWSFPSGAVKGYGVFATATGDPDGPYEFLAGGPTDADGIEVKMVSDFTADDLDYDLTQTSNGSVIDHVISTFYEGPMADGEQDVSVSVTFRKYIFGNAQGTVTISDTVKIKALKPTGTITAVHTGVAGVSSAPAMLGNTPRYRLGFDKDSSATNPANAQVGFDEANVGIKWEANVQLPGNRTGGVFMVVQTVTSSRSQVEKIKPNGPEKTWDYRLPKLGPNGAPIVIDGQEQSEPIHNALDGTFPYLSTFTVLPNGGNSPSPIAPVGATLKGFDSPSMVLFEETPTALPLSAHAHDDFVATVLYCPDPTNLFNTIWVPVAKLTWHWFASASHASGANPPWSTSGPVSSGAPASGATSEFPTWTRNVDKSKGYVVNS